MSHPIRSTTFISLLGVSRVKNQKYSGLTASTFHTLGLCRRIDFQMKPCACAKALETVDILI